MSVDRCVCCGAVIPEGRMVCQECWDAVREDEVKVIRCRECEYAQATRLGGRSRACRHPFGMVLVKPWSYCSYGKRRTEE